MAFSLGLGPWRLWPATASPPSAKCLSSRSSPAAHAGSAWASPGRSRLKGGISRCAGCARSTTSLMSCSACDNAGRRVEYWRADVGSPADRAALVDGVTGAFGGIDALVNNAGRAPRVRADLLDASEESFEDLDADEPPRSVLPHAGGGAPDGRTRRRPRRSEVRPPRSSAIVFITSVSAELASPNRGEYCVSKAGLAMAVKLFATKLAPHGSPGVRSPARHHPDRHDRRRARHLRSAHRRRPGPRRPLGNARPTSAGRSPRSCAAMSPTRRAA